MTVSSHHFDLLIVGRGLHFSRDYPSMATTAEPTILAPALA